VVFTGGGIGDTLYHIGHFQGIAAQSQDRRIAIACKKGREIGELLAGGKAAFVSDVIALATDQTRSGKVSIMRVARAFRACRFDTIFCLHDSLSVALAARLAGIPRRIGYAVNGRRGLHCYTYRLSVPKDTPFPHWMSKANRLLRSLDVPFDTAAARLVPSPGALAETSRVPAGAMLIALGVNASIPARQWGGARFAELAARLAALRPEAWFLLYGASDTAEVADRIRADSGVSADRLVDLTRVGCPLHVSHAFLSRCMLYVGNDSSGANLAVMTGIPAVTLFGPNPPLAYSPLIRPVLSRDASMDGISVEAVLDGCLPLLG